MQFSKTTRFARAQLRPILCIWSVMLPEACTSPAAPLPAPLPAPATPSHTGRPGSQGTCTPSLGPGLGADPTEKQLLHPAHKELHRYDAGQRRGWTRAKDGLFQPGAEWRLYTSSCALLRLAAALSKCYKSRAVTSSSSYAFCFSY